MACATPLLTEEGWPRPQEECREASFDGADGVVKDGTSSKERILKEFGNPNHPVCAVAVASHLFLDGAATPPMPGGELPTSLSLTPSLNAPPAHSPLLGQAPLRGGEDATINKMSRSLLSGEEGEKPRQTRPRVPSSSAQHADSCSGLKRC